MVYSPRYSLVIPCYNEADNLPMLVERCREVTSRRNNLEIIFVDNGSTDESASIFAAHIDTAREPQLRVCTVENNRGYGFGIVSGLHSAQGECLGWTHADMQTDPTDFLEAINLYESHGCKPAYIKGKRQTRPFRDQLFTTGMTLFEYGLLGYWMDDINAQPNLFQRSFFESLKSPPIDFSLDLYFFFSALADGLPLYRFPVVFGDRLHGVGHNDKLSAKLRYSSATISYSIKLKKHLKSSG